MILFLIFIIDLYVIVFLVVYRAHLSILIPKFNCMSLRKCRTIMFDSSCTYTHTFISLFYILQHDITHACYIHIYTIEAKYVYSSIKLYVVLHKQLIKSVKKNQVYNCL